MFRTKLVDMIYEELYNELHKKGHKDPKGRKLMKGDKDLDENIDIEVANAPQWTKEKMRPVQYIENLLATNETWQGRMLDSVS